MQLGRSYYRRLKSVKYEIYELYPSARHAYSTIRPAVKTSRPHFFKDLVTSSVPIAIGIVSRSGGFLLRFSKSRSFGGPGYPLYPSIAPLGSGGVDAAAIPTRNVPYNFT